jgi:3-oxoadipate enol-lactonase
MPYAEINGQNLYYEDSGGELPPVVFMHGYLFDHALFDPQVEFLKSDYRCIRVDARAHGQTRFDGQPFSLYDLAADVIALLDLLKIDQAAFVGMSQGGYTLVRLALRYPNRVKAAVFMSTYNGVDTEDVKTVYRSMRDAWAGDGKSGVIDVLANLFLGADPALRAVWLPKWHALPAGHIFHSMNTLIDRDDVTSEQLQRITVPTLVVHGEADQGIPITLSEKTLFSVLPRVIGFARIAGGVHAVGLTHPAATNTALKTFLDAYAR